MIKCDKQIKSIPRKLKRVRDMFNDFCSYCVCKGNEIGWMWTKGSYYQQMAYAYQWLYYDWARRSAYFQNWIHGSIRVANYDHQVYFPYAGFTGYYFGKNAATIMAELLEEALDLYKKYGQQRHSKAYAEQNISWLEKNIEKFKNCAKNEIIPEHASCKRYF